MQIKFRLTHEQKRAWKAKDWKALIKAKPGKISFHFDDLGNLVKVTPSKAVYYHTSGGRKPITKSIDDYENGICCFCRRCEKWNTNLVCSKCEN